MSKQPYPLPTTQRSKVIRVAPKGYRACVLERVDRALDVIDRDAQGYGEVTVSTSPKGALVGVKFSERIEIEPETE